VKRALASIAGLVGLATLGRWLAKRRHPVESVVEPVEATAGDDPAAELRRRLADARDGEPETPPASASPEVDETLDERRARVHAKAREAIDSMSDDGETS
jgi:hypothetical protein